MKQYLSSRFSVALAILCIVVVFWDLGGFELQNPDEGRYAEASREMLETGDWIIPHFADIERLNKPPLIYWVTASLFKTFGLHDWVARLGSALAGILGAVVTGLLARSMFGPGAGYAVPLILLSSLWYLRVARSLVTDAFLCAFIALALAAFWWGMQEGRWRHYVLFSVAAALAMLTKGPVGVGLPMLVIVLFLSITRQWNRIRWSRLGVASLVFLSISAPWFLAAQVRSPGFFHNFFVTENLQRYGGRYNEYPVWIYIPVLILGLFPWSLCLPTTAVNVAKAWRERRVASTAPNPILFLWLWFCVVFVFFSLGRGKLPSYILPCFPALAILIAKEWAEWRLATAPAARWQSQVSRWQSWLLLLVFLTALCLMKLHQRFPWENILPSLPPLVTSLFMAGLVMAVALRRGPQRPLFVATVLSGVFVYLGLHYAAKIPLSLQRVAPLSQRMARESDSDDILVAYRGSKREVASLFFYLGRTRGTVRDLRVLPALTQRDIYGDRSEITGPRAQQMEAEAETRLQSLAQSGKTTYCFAPVDSLARIKATMDESHYSLLIRNRRFALIRISDPDRSRVGLLRRNPGRILQRD